tara:strand:+ start:802 stop:1077 length:276 start_codon:yes stop_codon:yes gene_type:complete
MGKSSNRADGKRAKGKNKKKETFKKYGKNTSRGMRIKQAEMEKKAEKRKNEGDHYYVKGQMEHSKSKGKGSGAVSKSICKITCRNKKHGSK